MEKQGFGSEYASSDREIFLRLFDLAAAHGDEEAMLFTSDRMACAGRPEPTRIHLTEVRQETHEQRCSGKGVSYVRRSRGILGSRWSDQQDRNWRIERDQEQGLEAPGSRRAG